MARLVSLYHPAALTVNNDLPKFEDLVSIAKKVMFLECLDVKVYQALVKMCKCIQACFDFKFCSCFGKHLPKFKQNIPIHW